MTSNTPLKGCSRTVWIIKHGDTLPRGPDYGPLGPGLNQDGIVAATRLGNELRVGGTDTTSIATSEMERTIATARQMGGSAIRQYASLNEQEMDQPKRLWIREQIKDGIVIPELLTVGHNILNNPPEEPVWVTHGLVISGIVMATELGDVDMLFNQNCQSIQLNIRA